MRLLWLMSAVLSQHHRQRQRRAPFSVSLCFKAFTLPTTSFVDSPLNKLQKPTPSSSLPLHSASFVQDSRVHRRCSRHYSRITHSIYCTYCAVLYTHKHKFGSPYNSNTTTKITAQTNQCPISTAVIAQARSAQPLSKTSE